MKVPIDRSWVAEEIIGHVFRRILRTFILLVVRLLGVPGAQTAPRSTSKRQAGTPRVLLVRPDHLGDLVLTTPVFHALKQQVPKARVTAMVGPWSAEVVERHPDID